MRGTKITAIEPALTREIIISSQVPELMPAATLVTAATMNSGTRMGIAGPAIIRVITTGIIHKIILITMEAATGIAVIMTAATGAGTAEVTAAMEAAIPAVEILAAAVATNIYKSRSLPDCQEAADWEAPLLSIITVNACYV